MPAFSSTFSAVAWRVEEVSKVGSVGAEDVVGPEDLAVVRSFIKVVTWHGSFSTPKGNKTKKNDQ